MEDRKKNRKRRQPGTRGTERKWGVGRVEGKGEKESGVGSRPFYTLPLLHLVPISQSIVADGDASCC